MSYMPARHHAGLWNASGNRFAPALSLALRIGDPLILVAAALAAYAIRFGDLHMPMNYARLVSITVLFALLVLGSSSLYESWRGRGLLAEFGKVVVKLAVIFGGLLAYSTAIQVTDELSRIWLATWFGLSLAGAFGLRIGVRGIAGWIRARGADLRSAVIVGATTDSEHIVSSLRSATWAGIDVRGWFATPSDRGSVQHASKLGELDGLGAYVEDNHIDQVWIALPMRDEDNIAIALNQLQHSTADIKFVPDMFGLHLLNHSVEQVAGLPVINLQQTPLQGGARLIKALEDRILAGLILLMISPIMLAIAIAVKLSSPGPVFYRQERMSWNNKTFWMLKFRSMPVDAEGASGAVWAKAGESRATRVGSFLRKTSLDELPQFINVLLGDMSIVGPRPERPVFVHKFKHEIPSYMKKHMVKAGITGWAQVNGWRGSTDLHKRIECDLFYIENWSLSLDLKIVFMTIFKGFINKNAY
ncbi:undecaprenyl-phosphate glucose phosphotransferase [Stenotrophomonas maltophilia]|uniref:undecaprenyl-phosphate glucose phosphotransferase n=1 Tax=Stenotrophomonas maltophilia TaxID=40324 RepID=UPI001076415D|nr:undecaprenyl-phosphate glucose phosphotransferase [Stenotrophomonas maltophilia]TFZ45642.1 undecaprenyl-phosphate glucose phosphotransferase [Stenotrophomonas maltophilia]